MATAKAVIMCHPVLLIIFIGTLIKTYIDTLIKMNMQPSLADVKIYKREGFNGPCTMCFVIMSYLQSSFSPSISLCMCCDYSLPIV